MPVEWHQLHLGSDYSDEELEFLRAIEQYKRMYQRPFPTWREVLHVFKSLGWRKVPAASNRQFIAFESPPVVHPETDSAKPKRF